MELDDWQKEVMTTQGNLVLRSGRQVGKSTIIAKKAATYALQNPNKLVMVIAFVERQASLIFAKILNNLSLMDRNAIKKGKDKPTKHKIVLKNGTVIHCYAAGETGWGIMGYTIDLLIADEAAFINEEVWNSITPALAVTKGSIWLLSTPKLCEGFYYKCFSNPSYTAFHQSSEDCDRIPKEFLEEKKNEFTKAQYAQMYLGEFVDDFRRVFDDDWIDKVCTLSPVNVKPISRNGEGTYLGVDIAGMGEDESTFEAVQRKEGIVQQFHHETTEKTTTVETENKIIDLNAIIKFKQIGIDDGGIGTGVLDHLLKHDETKRITIGLNNARRVIDNDETTRMLYKEAMYYNMLAMGERGELKLFNCDEIKASLRCILVEENGKISGTNSHIAEGLIRAVWLAKDKQLNIWIDSIKI